MGIEGAGQALEGADRVLSEVRPTWLQAGGKVGFFTSMGEGRRRTCDWVHWDFVRILDLFATSSLVSRGECERTGFCSGFGMNVRDPGERSPKRAGGSGRRESALEGIYERRRVNEGIGRAQGDIVGILSADDWYASDLVRLRIHADKAANEL